MGKDKLGFTEVTKTKSSADLKKLPTDKKAKKSLTYHMTLGLTNTLKKCDPNYIDRMTKVPRRI